MKTLINGQRLVEARIPTALKELWNSSQIQGQLRRSGAEKPSQEIADLFEQESQDTITYAELSTIPAAEWKALARSGDRSIQVREENPLIQPQKEEPIRNDEENKENIPPPIYDPLQETYP